MKGITLALKQVEDSKHYGVAEVAKGKIKTLEEKQTKPKSNLVNLSIYFMEPTVFDQIKKLKSNAQRKEYEITDLLVNANAVVTNGFWMDIDYPWHLFNANEYLLSKMEANSDQIENSTINGKIIMENGARIINSFIEGTA